MKPIIVYMQVGYTKRNLSLKPKSELEAKMFFDHPGDCSLTAKQVIDAVNEYMLPGGERFELLNDHDRYSLINQVSRVEH